MARVSLLRVSSGRFAMSIVYATFIFPNSHFSEHSFFGISILTKRNEPSDENHLTNSEKKSHFSGKRVLADGRQQYLIEWDGVS